jgi:hypothetical protein
VYEDVKVTEGYKTIFGQVTAVGPMLRPSHIVVQKKLFRQGSFYGRDGIVEEITHLLMKETTRVCILGPGGMGKTFKFHWVLSNSLRVVVPPFSNPKKIKGGIELKKHRE